MTCYTDEQIVDFLTGRMSREEEVTFKHHIRECDHCAFRRYSKEDEFLTAYYEDAVAVGLIK